MDICNYSSKMFLEKIEQLIALLEKQELEVIVYNVKGNSNEKDNVFDLHLQSTNGVVSLQLYSELFAAYLYKNDL